MLAKIVTKSSDYNENRQWFQIVSILAASLTALNFGLNFAWTSPSIPILISPESPIKITFEECSYFPIIQSLSLMAMCPVLALVVEKVGRKNCVLFLSIPYCISWILTGTANSVIMLYLSRFFCGMGDAGVFTVLPMYIGEITEPRVRGTWGNMVGLGIYFGQFLINVIGGFLSIPLTALICGLITIFHIIIFPFMPESPYFLLMKGRDEEARKSLQILRWRSNVDAELERLRNDVTRQISEKSKMIDLFREPVNRRALLIGGGLRLSQQFCGMPAFGVYTQYLFEKAGSSVTKRTSSIVYTGCLLIIMGTNMFLMDRFGRKRSMIISSVGCGLTLFLIGGFLFVGDRQLMDVSSVGWIPLFGMVVWLLFAGNGLGLVPLLMLGELFSASVKGKAVSVVCVIFAVGFLTVTKVFQTLAYNFGLFAPFLFFAVCCVVILLFSIFFVPETKGKTLEEIQQMLLKNEKV